MKHKKILFVCVSAVIIVFCVCVIKANHDINLDTILTDSSALSNKKIGWGIKRADNNEQPDLGKVNKELLEQYNGIAMGNSEKKYVYLTFDEGYEAGYTERILDTLQQNDVTATFFITAHYLNTREDLVKKMIDEGHIVGNHTPKSLMSDNLKIRKV